MMKFELTAQTPEPDKREIHQMLIELGFDAIAPAPEVNPHTRLCVDCDGYHVCRIQFEGATGCSQIF